MRSDKTEPGDSPRQPQFIDKRSSRAKPVPARTVTKPQRSPRIKAGPQAPLAARDKQAKTRTINRQVIGSKRNSAKHVSGKRISSVIRTQLKIDEAAQELTKMDNTAINKRHDTARDPIFTYHVPYPKNKPSPTPVTQEEPKIQPTAAATPKSAKWKLDGRVYIW